MIMNKTYIWDRTKIKFKMAAKFNTRSHYSLQIKITGTDAFKSQNEHKGILKS